MPNTIAGRGLPLTKKLCYSLLAVAIFMPFLWTAMEIIYRIRFSIPITGGILYEDDLRMSENELRSHPYYGTFLDTFRLSENRVLFYEPRPGFRGDFYWIDSQSAQQQVSINSHGFRDREYSVAKDPGTFRIVVLGDSIVWGDGLPLESTFAKQLEQQLNERFDRNFEVLNFGVSGYSTRQEVELYRVRANKFDPDLVIVGYCLNDFDENYSAEGQAFRRLYYDIFHKSYLLDHLRRTINALFDEAIGFSFGTRQSQFDLSEQFRLLQSYCDGRPSVVVVFPALLDFDNYLLSNEHRRVADALEGLNFEMLDLLDSFRDYNPKDLALMPDDTVHPNQLGNRIAAEVTMKLLINEQLIPTATRNHIQ